MLVSFFAGQAMAVLTKHPKSSQIFSGESVTLRCNIQRGEVTDWKYTWSKDDVDSISRKHEYEITAESDQGPYWCQGEIQFRSISSIISDPVTITVKDRPQAVLGVSPQSLNPGDSVTLSCGVKESSTGWRFCWSYSVEHTKGCVCRAGRGDPVYDTVNLSFSAQEVTSCIETSLSQSCEEKRNSTGWRLKRYREKAAEKAVWL
uniref:Ig-like domain-containing protein n=1 Tax=Oncorhynchus tshawytscha TaxID=74940 RepID=A0A8C8JQT3_ONCTS